MKRIVISICAVLWTLLVVLWIAGCGGGGGKGGGGSLGAFVKASGKLIVPSNFRGPLANFTVLSSVDREKVAANGTFTLNVDGTGEALVSIQDSNGNSVLYGYVDGGPSGSSQFASGQGEVSATQTAVFLLYQGLGAYSLSPDTWSQTITLLEKAPQTATLANVISTQIASDPLALSDGNAQVHQAISAAMTSIQASSQANFGKQPLAMNSNAQQTQTLRVAVTRTTSGSNGGFKVIVLPTTEQSGLLVADTGDGSGSITITNFYRRRVAAFIYETAVQAKPGNGNSPVQITPKPLVGMTQPSPLVKLIYADRFKNFPNGGGPYEIQASNRLNGAIGSFVDIAFGNKAFDPSQSSPITLPQDGTNYLTVYTIILIGPGTKSGLATFGPATSGPLAQYADDWYNVLAALTVEEVVVDVIVPMVANMILSEKSAEQFEDATGSDLGLINDIANTLIGTNDLLVQIQQGNFTGILDTLAQSTADFGTIRDKVVEEFLLELGGSNNKVSQYIVANVGEKTKVLSIADLLLQIADSSIVGGAVYNSNAGEQVTATLVPSPVSISPNVGDVYTTVPNLQLIANPDSTSKVPHVYDWIVGGTANGTVRDSNNKTGTSIETTDYIVKYVMNSNALTTQSDVVQVKVYINKGTEGNPVKGDFQGQAEAKISISGDCAPVPNPVVNAGSTISVEPQSIDYGEPMTVTASLDISTPTDDIPYVKNPVWKLIVNNFGPQKGNGSPGMITAVDGVPLKPPIVVNNDYSNNFVLINGSKVTGIETHTFTIVPTYTGNIYPACGSFSNTSVGATVSATLYSTSGVDEGSVGLANGQCWFNILPGSNGTGDN